jgi:phosphatidylglycerol:prolipoprotein diacylglycerol transferase
MTLALAFPYFEQPSLKLGPLTFHAFGALVALAVLFGTWILRRRSVEEKLSPEVSAQMVFWVLVAGFLGAHLVDRLVYFPHDTFERPITILKVWEGISSFGGLLGGAVGAALFIRQSKMNRVARWRYLDAIAYAFVFGWIFGRLGCTVAFDHPGTPTDFFLGEVYRDGVQRHNLGLYEAIYFVPLSAVYWAVGRKRRAPGFFVALLCVLYPPVRFGFDFLRTIDVRYLGLTPAQWGSIAFVILGFFLFAYGRKLAAAEAAGETVETPSAAAAKKGSSSGKKKRR